MANLGPQFIKNSYQDLVQITASNALAKGDGTSISNISVTASWAQSASNAVNAQTASFLSGAFLQGGNSFGATALLGTNDTQDLQLETSGSVRVHISSSGNVGIGTTTPDHNLVVNGNTGVSINANGATFPNIHRDSTDGGMLLRSWNGSTFTNNVKITPTSNVGIGTTSPTQRLDVRDGFIQVSGSGASGYGYLLNRAGQDTYSIRHLDGGLTINNETDSVKEMTFLGNGNVGINKINPSARLEIRGSGATSATTALRVENSNASASLVVLDDRQTRITSDEAALFVQGAGVSPFTQNIAEFRYAGNGNSLIISQQNGVAGLTTSTNANLNISPNGTGATVFLTGKQVRLNNSSDNGTIALQNTGATGQTRLDFITGSSTIMSISGSGRVGVGTTTPRELLHVAGGNIALDGTRYIDWGSGNSRITDLGLVSGQGYPITISTFGPIAAGASNSLTEKLRLTGSGSLGLGTTNPLARLHVSGSDGNDFLRVTSGSQNILNIRSGSAVFFAGTGVAPTSGFDLDVQGTGTAFGGSVRFAANGSEWRFGSVSSVNRDSTGNSELFNVTMGGTSATAIQNPMSVTFNANQSSTGGSGYTVLRVNATHATTAGTGSKLLQTWEFGGVQRSVVNITGSIGVGITTPSASIHISSSLGLAPILAITPHHPLPTTNIPTGSFMVSSSIPPKPFFWDGTTWNALY